MIRLQSENLYNIEHLSSVELSKALRDIVVNDTKVFYIYYFSWVLQYSSNVGLYNDECVHPYGGNTRVRVFI